MSDLIILFGLNEIPSIVGGVVPPSPPGADALLMETGDYLLLETGDNILLE